MLKKLPIGIQTFKNIVDRECLYIDKTKHIYNLLNSGYILFLSRPRRFGKSLLLSTIEAIYTNQKELFKDYWIYNSDWQWEKEERPVIRLDMSTTQTHTSQELKESIKSNLEDIIEKHNLEISLDRSIADIFKKIIIKLSKKKQIVILIDEYDKPLIDNIKNLKVAQENKRILKDFYTILKAQEENIKFLLITGVSKFSRVSVFSGLNNLTDLTMSPDFADLLGYTQEEVEKYFPEYIKKLAKVEEMTEKETLIEIKKWFNGYRFTRKNIKVYNPFSTLLLFFHKEFLNFWFESATPTFLINLIKEKNYDFPKVENLKLPYNSIKEYEIEKLQLEPLLLQTGYLTISDYNRKLREYTLNFPNFEVKESFNYFLLQKYTDIKEYKRNYIFKIIKALNENNLEKMFESLGCFFADINYELHIKKEVYWQTIFYCLFTMLGFEIEAEVRTNRGRIDVMIKTEKQIFIFEFKLYESAEKALEQIKEKKYFEKFLKDEKEIVLVGARFNMEKEKSIVQWVSEKLKN